MAHDEEALISTPGTDVILRGIGDEIKGTFLGMIEEHHHGVRRRTIAPGARAS
jgi:hypothetical protein